MAGRQKDRFRERDRRRDRYTKDYDYYEDRRSNSFSSNDDEDTERECYSSNKDNYNSGYRRYSNERNDRNNRRSEDWHENRNDRRVNRSNDRYRSRSRERDSQSRRSRDSQSDRYDNEQYDRRKEEVTPNNTIMLRNLGLQIIENEILSKLAEFGLKPKEIRLMRKKDTGTNGFLNFIYKFNGIFCILKNQGESRGFAFVEFNDVNEASYWKNQTQGHVMFSDGQQATLHFSIPKESYNTDRNNQLQQKVDWTCYKCGVNNFKRRDVCFKCATTREESAANETGDEISPVPTNCLLFRNLNPYTTEERILTILGTFSSLPIKSIKIPKENSASMCVCFVELYTTQEAAQIHTLLSSLTSGFIIDDFPITICYAKRNVQNSNGLNSSGLKNAASMALAAAAWTNQSTSDSKTIEQSSSTGKANKSNLEQPSSLSNSITPSNSVQTIIPLNAPILNNGIDYGSVVVNGRTYRKYPQPDASAYVVLEDVSGFYYDSLTCLYYDPNSHYYYNGQTQKYMYWSNEHQTYLPAETQQQTNTTTNATSNESANKKEASQNGSSNGTNKEDAKEDKVKTAKKIQKEMEKWAKTLNQKSKDSASKQVFSNNQEESTSNSSTSASNHNSISLGNSGVSLNINNLKEVSKPKLIKKNPLFDAFNDSEPVNKEPKLSEEDPTEKATPSTSNKSSIVDKSDIQKLNLTDWDKLICKLCNRQLASKEQLIKHQQETNLYKLTGFHFTQEQIAELSQNDGEFNFSYRDRAKERREKYGQSDQPEVPSSRYKEKYMRGIKNVLQQDDYTSSFNLQSNQNQSLQNSIGAKLLKQMGWNDGEGLGKANQGRSSLIEVERRTQGVGLGAGGKQTTHPSGESYKDAVKRTMLERYKKLHEEELARNS